MKPKISIIVSVYNIEEYIAECIESLIKQTYKNIEIICVDDFSSDNSYEILKKYEQEYSNIKLVRHPANKGSSCARNTGLEIATGKYIYFIDGDDFIEKNLLLEMVQLIEKNNNTVIVHNPNYVVYYEDNLEKNYSVGKLSKNAFELNNITHAPWTNLFSLDFLKKLVLNSLKV